MLEVADIVRAAGEAYRRLHGPRMLPSHRRAMHDLAACRTAALGGHVRACDHCGARQYRSHSCRNRHCPKCHATQTRRWLDTQRSRLLPCASCLVTFTLPAELRPLARSNQKLVYRLLMTAAARALLTLTADPDSLGARPGLLAVLHTWTRAMLSHPHVHILVTAGGWRDGADPGWVASRHPQFLVPGWALSVIFRATFRDALRKAGLLAQAPTEVWSKAWVVHLQHAGTGEKVLDYLARYVFRIALVNSRLERFADGQVTFRFRDGRTGTTKRCTLDAVSVIGRFLQHVLPAGFAKVRHDGLLSPSRARLLDQARTELVAPPPSPPPPALPAIDPAPVPSPENPPTPRCPVCGIGGLHLVETLPRWGLPP